MSRKDTYQVIVNDEEFTLSKEEYMALDMVKTSKSEYHVINNQFSKYVSVDANASNPKKLTVHMDGSKYNILIKDEIDQVIDDMGFHSSSQTRIENIIAPMPGLVLELLVKEGDSVSKGDSLLILGAMKMENQILSIGDIKVKGIKTKVGDSVEKGQVLIEVE